MFIYMLMFGVVFICESAFVLILHYRHLEEQWNDG